MDTTQSLRAMAHPLRLRILSLLTGAELSAAEVARELDLSHANASYHLRVLLDAELLEVAGEERIRGGVALADWLRQHGVTDVDVCGIATDYCVRATALDAVREGFATRLLAGLCAGVAEESSTTALREMAEAGVTI